MDKQPLAVIPSCGESPLLFDLVSTLSRDSSVLVMLNSVKGDPEPLWTGIAEAGGTPLHYRQPVNIYHLWNKGIELARQARSTSLSILNDDIRIGSGSVLAMDQIIQAGWGAVGWDYLHPDMNNLDRMRRVDGSYRRGGIGGFAFAINPWAPPRLIDERFSWWGGDDDLFNLIREAGFDLGVAVGIGVHHETSTSSNARPEVLARTDADRQLLMDIWGETW